MKSTLGGMFIMVLLIFLCIQASAAGNIQRNDLRLELLLATGSLDTSENARVVSSTGIAPIFVTDSQYGISYAQFSGSGWIRVNTSWGGTQSDDFSMSFWTKINPSTISWNTMNNQTSLLKWVPAGISSIITSYYDKPNVLFSTKSASNDNTAIRFATSKEWQCSLNSSQRQEQLTPGSSIWRYIDVYASMENTFNCQTIIDNKWHHVVLTRKSGNLKIFIDGLPVWSGPFAGTIWRYISFGMLWFIPNSTMYSVFPNGIGNLIYQSHFFRWWMAGFRLYNRSISEGEIEALGDEFRYAQTELTGVWNMQLVMEKYNKPDLLFHIKNIPLNLPKDQVVYEYAIDGKTFLPLYGVVDVSNSTGSLSYRVGLNMTTVPDGKITLTLRVKSKTSYQNIGALSFTKYDASMSININQPSTETSTSKTISATTETGNILTMIQTRGSLCDASLTGWEEYSDITYASKSDNDMRICYRSMNPFANKTIYKLSMPIQGILTNEDKTNMTTNKFFDNYLNWPKSFYQKSDDTASMMLDLLWVNATQAQWTINGVTLTDINGDGLVDFLYSRTDPIRRIIIVNNGNFTFKISYKCAIDASGTVWSPTLWRYLPAPTIYYGDCADITR